MHFFECLPNKVLKEYLLKGYSINQRLTDIEQRIDNKLFQHEQRIGTVEQKLDFFVRTSLPPIEGIFFNGQIFDAYKWVSDLIRSAKQSLILIDNYIDESVLLLLSKRDTTVTATIYTRKINNLLRLDLERHNAQYPPIDVQIKQDIHDRFLIIDSHDVYHIGASIKDLGKKLFAFSKLQLPVDMILPKDS